MEITHLQEGPIKHSPFCWLQNTKDSAYYLKPIVDTGYVFLEPIHHSSLHREYITVHSSHVKCVFFFMKFENGEQIKQHS